MPDEITVEDSTQLIGVKYVEPEGGPFIAYSNHINITWTALDVRLHFGEFVDVSQELKYVIEKNAIITIAWPQAKQIVGFLTEAVRRYEELNGDIKIPPELKSPQ